MNQRAGRGNHYRPLTVRNRSVNSWSGTDPSATVCGLTDNGVCAYGQESTTGFGTARVGSERAPGYQNLDANLSKSFPVTEGTDVRFRANSYNVPNTTSLGPPDASSSSTTFELINSTIFDGTADRARAEAFV